MSEMNMFNKSLKPCPFCGEGAEINHRRFGFVVECSSCNISKVTASTFICRSEEERNGMRDYAIDEWNEREYEKGIDQHLVRIVELEKSLQAMTELAEHQMHPEVNDPSMFEGKDFDNLAAAKKLLDQHPSKVIDVRGLRKFKLINREGYINANGFNKVVLKYHFVEDIVEGYVDEEGNLMMRGYCIVVIRPKEFKFFEEVLT